MTPNDTASKAETMDAAEPAGKQKDDPQPARVTVNLPSAMWDELVISARKHGISRTEALRRAVWIYLYFMRRIHDDKCEIVLERPNGEKERLLFPY